MLKSQDFFYNFAQDYDLITSRLPLIHFLPSSRVFFSTIIPSKSFWAPLKSNCSSNFLCKNMVIKNLLEMSTMLHFYWKNMTFSLGRKPKHSAKYVATKLSRNLRETQLQVNYLTAYFWVWLLEIISGWRLDNIIFLSSQLQTELNSSIKLKLIIWSASGT